MRITGIIPENIRRCMPKDDRADIGKAAMTNEDAQASRVARREKELQENIANLLRQRNIWFMRQRMDRKTTGTVGAPDFLFAVNGKACAFEVKLPGENPTTDQAKCHDAMIANGWALWVVRSELEAVQLLELLIREFPTVV